MTRENAHPSDALQELLDGRLAADRRAEAEDHVAGCERCRRELEVLRWTRRTLRDESAATPPPASLESDVLAALDREDTPGQRPAARAGRRPFLLAAAAALAAAALATVLLRLGPDVPSSLARDFTDYQAGRLALERTVDDVASLEGFFDGSDLDFDVRVLDLAMMSYAPVGGRVHSVAGSPSALFVYRGPQGQILICQMFRGRLEDLPEPEVRRSSNGIAFRVYARDGKTVVAWQEGVVVCVLVSDLEQEQVIQLAIAKAMRASDPA